MLILALECFFDKPNVCHYTNKALYVVAFSVVFDTYLKIIDKETTNRNTLGLIMLAYA